MTQARRALGAAGEAAAASWYEARGYRVLARNWRCPDGELDLVLWRDGTVVFCEVKARSSTTYGAPAEAVHTAKQHRLRRLAGAWLGASGRDVRVAELRFDVVSVVAGELEVLEAAF